MTDLRERFAKLSRPKRELLVQRMREQGREVPLALYPLLRSGEPPLAPNQKRLWFINELDPEEGAAYHMPQVVQLRGALDVDALGRAIGEVVARHDVLRTTFEVSTSGEPTQVTHAPRPFALEVSDLSTLDSDERARALDAALLAEATKLFDFANEAPFRAALFKTAEEEHVFTVVMHHIVSDGWSMGVFIGEMVACYQAFVKGEAPALPELEVQYRDYCSWLVEQDVAESQAEFWRETLAGYSRLELPYDRSGAGRQGATLDFEVPRELAVKLRELGRQTQCTPFMVFSAALQLVLSRWAGQNDVAIGTTVAGRQQAAIESLIGYFSTAVVLRTEIVETETVRELLARTREASLGALDNQAHLPFSEIAAEMGLSRNDGNPFFDVMFVFQNLAATGFEMSEVDAVIVDPPTKKEGLAKFDIDLEIYDTDGALPGILTYRTTRFDESTIVAFLTRLLRVLGLFLENPERRLCDIEVLDNDEREMLVRTWGTGPQQTIPETTVHGMFEAQVARGPERDALVFEGGSWTYEELNRRADNVAASLVEAGVEGGAVVGVSMQRSPELIAALLGVMKCGAAYVPMEPDLPSSRLDYLREDSGATVVIVGEAGRAATSWGVKLLSVAEAPDAARAASPEVPPEASAYYIYTSGTTGHPKGVVVSHRAVVNHLLSKRTLCRYRGDETFLCRSSFSFDASVTEIFVALTIGGRLVIAAPGGHRDPDYLIGLIRDHRVQVMESVPSALGLLVGREGFASCDSLEKVVLGGEALSAQMRDEFYRTTGALLFNPYGPTEATVETTMHECDPARDTVSIGKPMHGYEVYVLDAALRVQPSGVPGELHIGGVGLADGYLGRPRLTALSFIPSPFSEAGGARMYRSGDVVRWAPDGVVDYIGRRDHQIQVRGVRVELGEVEALIKTLPGIGEAVVLAVNESDGRADSLVAYVVRKN